jgi:hypothetical protein
MDEGQRDLIEHLAVEAKSNERDARESGDVQRAEYFRGLSAAFTATLTLLED